MQIFWLLAFLPPSSLSVSKSILFYYFVDWIRACYCMSPSSLSTFYFRPVSQEKKKGVGGKSGRPRTKKDVSGRPVPFLPVCSSKKSRKSSIRLRVKKKRGGWGHYSSRGIPCSPFCCQKKRSYGKNPKIPSYFRAKLRFILLTHGQGRERRDQTLCVGTYAILLTYISSKYDNSYMTVAGPCVSPPPKTGSWTLGAKVKKTF